MSAREGERKESLSNHVIVQAAENPEWLKEARHGEHTPESVEYGITSFTFRSRRPFHPARLYAALNRATAPRSRDATAAEVAKGDLCDPLEALESVVRAKGVAYIATAGGWNMQATLSLAGSRTYVIPGSPWWANLDEEDWPEGLSDAIMPLWDETHGDRQSEVVVIGRHMDHKSVEAALESCVLSANELAASPPETWETAFADPWDWAELIAKSIAEHEDNEGHGHGHEHSHDHGHAHACATACEHEHGN